MKLNFARLAEERAKAYLIRSGYRIIDQNWFSILHDTQRGRSAKGEIDLIALSPDNHLVFIEVKSSKNPQRQLAFALTQRQSNSIKTLANIYIYRFKMHEYPVRFQLITLNLIQNYWRIKHYTEAIQ